MHFTQPRLDQITDELEAAIDSLSDGLSDKVIADCVHMAFTIGKLDRILPECDENGIYCSIMSRLWAREQGRADNDNRFRNNPLALEFVRWCGDESRRRLLDDPLGFAQWLEDNDYTVPFILNQELETKKKQSGLYLIRQNV